MYLLNCCFGLVENAKQIKKTEDEGVGEVQKENQEAVVSEAVVLEAVVPEAVVSEAVVPTGFTVLGGFENKLAPKVL